MTTETPIARHFAEPRDLEARMNACDTQAAFDAMFERACTVEDAALALPCQTIEDLYRKVLIAMDRPDALDRIELRLWVEACTAPGLPVPAPAAPAPVSDAHPH